MNASPTFVLVHSAWHGPWAWEPVVERLGAEGIEARLVKLPSVGSDPAALGDLYDDARAVREAIDAVEGPAVVVGHSYGGEAMTEGAADATDVLRLVYLTAFMLDTGESLFAAVGGAAPDWWIDNGDGTLTADRPAEIFYNAAPADVADRAAARLVLQSKTAFMQPLRAAAWHQVPSTYVVCERDNAIPVFAQEAMSERADDVRRLDADHVSSLSRPDELTTILREVAGT